MNLWDVSSGVEIPSEVENELLMETSTLDADGHNSNGEDTNVEKQMN